jgi:hypothetical protein
VAEADVPTEFVRVTATEPMAVEEPVRVKGIISEKAPP